MKRILDWSPIVLGLIFTFVLVLPLRERALTGRNDFVSFYTGGQLAGTPGLYTREANQSAIRKVLGVDMDGTAFVRPPYYSILMRPFSWLPYKTAYALFSLTTLFSILWFVARFSRECPALPFFASIGFPLAASIALGQDTAYLLLFIGLFILLWRQGKDFWAGMVLALCLTKFHLFLFVPVVFLLKKRWALLAGGGTGVASLMGLGMAVGGWRQISAWIHVMRDPWVTPDPNAMPNLHRLALAVGGGWPVDVMLLVLLTGTLLWITQKTENLEMLFALCLVGGQLANVHYFLADAVLLFPVFVLLTGATSNTTLRAATALVATPIPHLLSFLSPAWAPLLPLMLLALLGAAAFAVTRKSSALCERANAVSKTPVLAD